MVAGGIAVLLHLGLRRVVVLVVLEDFQEAVRAEAGVRVNGEFCVKYASQ